MKKISISMAKGGVGKTTTAVNLSAALAKSGKRVLLVDCDPQQGNATLFLGHNPNGLKITIANVINALLDLGTPQFIHEAAIHQAENFDLLPANPKLEAIQNRLIAEKSSTIFGGETGIQPHEVLKTILREAEDKYDYAVLDCPPSISMLSINALVAADSVLLPVEAHYECYEALMQTIDVISRIKMNWNPDLQVEGILLTKYQSCTRLCREVSDYTRNNFGTNVKVFENAVPSSIRMAELSSVGISIFEHSPNSEAALAYEKLAEDVMLNG